MAIVGIICTAIIWFIGFPRLIGVIIFACLADQLGMIDYDWQDGVLFVPTIFACIICAVYDCIAWYTSWNKNNSLPETFR